MTPMATKPEVRLVWTREAAKLIGCSMSRVCALAVAGTVTTVGWRHQRIKLLPVDPTAKPIEIELEKAGAMMLVGVLSPIQRPHATAGLMQPTPPYVGMAGPALRCSRSRLQGAFNPYFKDFSTI